MWMIPLLTLLLAPALATDHGITGLWVLPRQLGECLYNCNF